jgi:large subunit ribosomal protein L12|tara:strand:+ start:4137 stop:4442 length:306 start_codon:yes stop_codon:yes gene_type:complete
MEYIYAALLLHKLEQKIDEDTVKKVITSTGVEPDEVKVKALVSALSEVNIEDALKNAATAMAAPAAPAESSVEAKAEDKPAEEKDEKKEEEAMEGLASLFG